VWAAGYKEGNGSIEVQEGTQQSLDIKLTK